MSGKIGQRMLKDIPIIGCQQNSAVGFRCRLVIVAVVCSHLLTGLVHCNSIGLNHSTPANANAGDNSTDAGGATVLTQTTNLHPVFFSEYKLRSIIEGFNKELRQLKQDFMEQITSVYFNLKLDSESGFERADKEEKANGGRARVGGSRELAANIKSTNLALTLMGEQFADIVIKKYIIQRRLLAGLKVAFVKFLPVETLKRLIERFQSYSWLGGQNQIDLRPKFPNATEPQFIDLYELIELRARIRAADDLLTLAEDNIRRILNIIQVIIIDQKQENEPFNRHGSKILDYFIKELFGKRKTLQQYYQNSLEQSDDLVELVQGGQIELIKFIDRVIDAEALDIDLSHQATNLDLPPTINEKIINNVERKWIPKSVLDSVSEDRSLLLGNKDEIKYLIVESSSSREFDLFDWCKTALLAVNEK